MDWREYCLLVFLREFSAMAEYLWCVSGWTTEMGLDDGSWIHGNMGREVLCGVRNPKWFLKLMV
jgi:hypothetical protein